MPGHNNLPQTLILMICSVILSSFSTDTTLFRSYTSDWIQLLLNKNGSYSVKLNFLCLDGWNRGCYSISGDSQKLTLLPDIINANHQLCFEQIKAGKVQSEIKLQNMTDEAIWVKINKQWTALNKDTTIKSVSSLNVYHNKSGFHRVAIDSLTKSVSFNKEVNKHNAGYRVFKSFPYKITTCTFKGDSLLFSIDTGIHYLSLRK